MGTPAIEPKHNFVTKLRQPSVLPRILEYIEWQKSVRKAEESGKTPPPPPQSLTPISINLDLTTTCNYQCTHCIDWDILNQKIKYDHEKLLASLEEMIKRGLRSVILIGGGEPTLYPKFPDFIRFLKERSVQVAIVSNGSRNQAILDSAKHFSRGDWVRLSLDSGTNDTFIKMHKPLKNITLEHICSWIPKIRDANSALSVGFSYIIVWKGAEREKDISIIPNIDEIVTATKLARENRFNYISLKPFLTRHPEGSEVMDLSVIDDFNNTVQRIREAVDEAKKYETEDFKVIESTNLRVLESGTWRDYTQQPNMCHKQAYQQVLSPLGLYNCPVYRGVPRARIGDKDAYCGSNKVEETKESVAHILSNFDASHECANVTCLYNGMNWWIEKAIKGELNPSELKALEERNDYFL